MCTRDGLQCIREMYHDMSVILLCCAYIISESGLFESFYRRNANATACLLSLIGTLGFHVDLDFFLCSICHPRAELLDLRQAFVPRSSGLFLASCIGTVNVTGDLF